jgi:hypothetical protein
VDKPSPLAPLPEGEGDKIFEFKAETKTQLPKC